MLKISLLFVVVLVSSVQAKDTHYQTCGQNSQSQELARLIMTDNDQKRVKLECNALLSEIAAQKAKEMAREGRVSHYGEGGAPDFRLKKAGYPLSLPTSAVGSNHVESIMGGVIYAEDALHSFRNSYAHRIHLFAEHPFYLEQSEIGVGYAEEWNSPHVNYWVVYIAKPRKLPVEDDAIKAKTPEQYLANLGVNKK